MDDDDPVIHHDVWVYTHMGLWALSSSSHFFYQYYYYECLYYKSLAQQHPLLESDTKNKNSTNDELLIALCGMTF